MKPLNLRWNLDSVTELPHFYEKHGVHPEEVEEVLARPAENRKGSEGSMVAIGATSTGLVLKVIYVLDEVGDGAFVVTAYPLSGKTLLAFHRRMRRRGRR